MYIYNIYIGTYTLLIYYIYTYTNTTLCIYYNIHYSVYIDVLYYIYVLQNICLNTNR